MLRLNDLAVRQRMTAAWSNVSVVCRRLWCDWGWPAFAGGALALVALALLLGGAARRATAQYQGAAASEASAGAWSATARPALDAIRVWRVDPELRPPLPQARQVTAVIQQLKSLAQDNGVTWQSGQYKRYPLSKESLARLEIHATLKGSYAHIKRLLMAALDAHSALAMREVAIKRANVDDVELEVQVHWVLYLQDGWMAELGDAQPGLGAQR
jgi:hypothetical protein